MALEVGRPVRVGAKVLTTLGADACHPYHGLGKYLGFPRRVLRVHGARDVCPPVESMNFQVKLGRGRTSQGPLVPSERSSSYGLGTGGHSMLNGSPCFVTSLKAWRYVTQSGLFGTS